MSRRNTFLSLLLFCLLGVTYYLEEVVKKERVVQEIKRKRLLKFDPLQTSLLQSKNFSIAKDKGTFSFSDSREKVNQEKVTELVTGLNNLYIYDSVEEGLEWKDWDFIKLRVNGVDHLFYFSKPFPVNYFFHVVHVTGEQVSQFVALNYESIKFPHKEADEQFHRYELFSKRLKTKFEDLVDHHVFAVLRKGVWTFKYRSRNALIIDEIKHETSPAPYPGLGYRKESFVDFHQQLTSLVYLEHVSDVPVSKALLQISGKEVSMELFPAAKGYYLKVKGHRQSYLLAANEGKKLFYNAQDFWDKNVISHLQGLKAKEDIVLDFSNEKLQVPMKIEFGKRLIAKVDQEASKGDELISSLLPKLENFLVLFKVIFSAEEYGQAIRVLDRYEMDSTRKLTLEIAGQKLVLSYEHGELIVHPEGSSLWYFFVVPESFSLKLSAFFKYKSSS
jgi:hypothetical protein